MISLKSITIPEEIQRYQRIVNLIWDNEITEKNVDNIVNQLVSFYNNNETNLKFIQNMFSVCKGFQIKNDQIFDEILTKFITKALAKQDSSIFLLLKDIRTFRSTDDWRDIDELRFAIAFHRNDIVEDILNTDFDLFQQIATMDILQYMNYQVFLFAIKNNIYSNARDVRYLNYDFVLVNLYPMEFFQCIVRYGYDVNFCYFQYYDLYDLLTQALENEKYELAKFLVIEGANVNSKQSISYGSTTYNSYTPLKFAAMYSNIDMAKFLLAHGANANETFRSCGCFHHTEKNILVFAPNIEMRKLLEPLVKNKIPST